MISELVDSLCFNTIAIAVLVASHRWHPKTRPIEWSLRFAKICFWAMLYILSVSTAQGVLAGEWGSDEDKSLGLHLMVTCGLLMLVAVSSLIFGLSVVFGALLKGELDDLPVPKFKTWVIIIASWLFLVWLSAGNSR